LRAWLRGGGARGGGSGALHPYLSHPHQGEGSTCWTTSPRRRSHTRRVRSGALGRPGASPLCPDPHPSFWGGFVKRSPGDSPACRPPTATATPSGTWPQVPRTAGLKFAVRWTPLPTKGLRWYLRVTSSPGWGEGRGLGEADDGPRVAPEVVQGLVGRHVPHHDVRVLRPKQAPSSRPTQLPSSHATPPPTYKQPLYLSNSHR